MRGVLLLIAAATMLVFAGPGLALDSGLDCAEGADDDLVTADSEIAQPEVPFDKPIS